MLQCHDLNYVIITLSSIIYLEASLSAAKWGGPFVSQSVSLTSPRFPRLSWASCHCSREDDCWHLVIVYEALEVSWSASRLRVFLIASRHVEAGHNFLFVWQVFVLHHTFQVLTGKVAVEYFASEWLRSVLLPKLLPNVIYVCFSSCKGRRITKPAWCCWQELWLKWNASRSP